MTLPRFYPVVPDAAWVARLAALGVRLIQLRLKAATPAQIDTAAAASLAACRAHGATLVVNDHWAAALAHGAPYVHLGQEDLATADVPALRAAGIAIGISTHDEAELDTALSVTQDYVALGPIYHTTLKAMRFAPQGTARLMQWRHRIGRVPLVAIGGITLERAPDVFAAGADSIAVVSDIVAAVDPDARTRAWLDLAG